VEPEYRRNVEPVNASSGDGDLLEGGADRPRVGRSIRLVFGVTAATLVGLLVGYAVGHDRSPSGTVGSTAPTATTTPRERLPPVSGPAFTQTGVTCSVQHGHRLQLGIQIVNQTNSIAHITRVVTNEPLAGLRQVAARVGACGQDSGTQASFDPGALPAGDPTWVTVTVHVLVSCPGPDPVQFVVHVVQGQRTSIDKLPGFVDLSNVPYTGCAHDA
jgi:hypothetical protein